MPGQRKYADVEIAAAHLHGMLEALRQSSPVAARLVGRDASDEKRLSPADLVIASVSSAAAAVIVHALWKPGTVIAAALTPS